MTFTSAPAPYRYVADERKAALFDKGRRPRNLAELLTWARVEWAAEVPESLHSRGVWHDKEDGAGSSLGTPETSPEARSYLERRDDCTDSRKNDDDETHADRAYQKPMHAALRRIHSEYGSLISTDNEYWHTARFLFALALNGFDWQGVCERRTIPAYVARAYTEWALGLWWEKYERAPLRT